MWKLLTLRTVFLNLLQKNGQFDAIFKFQRSTPFVPFCFFLILSTSLLLFRLAFPLQKKDDENFELTEYLPISSRVVRTATECTFPTLPLAECWLPRLWRCNEQSRNRNSFITPIHLFPMQKTNRGGVLWHYNVLMIPLCLLSSQ